MYRLARLYRGGGFRLLVLFACLVRPAPAAAQTDAAAGGDEYVVYFISSTFCIANREPRFHEAVREMMGSVRARAEAESRTVALAGVSVDVSAAEGIRYLSDFGEFDEIVSGSNWLNTAMVHLVWRGEMGPPTIPQVIVVRRQIDRSDRTTLRMGPDEPVMQVVGTDAFQAWVAAGTPLVGAEPESPEGS